MPVCLISLDGVPGAGKSVLLKELQRKFSNSIKMNIICLQEPVDEWSNLKDCKGNTLFNLYYQNQKRYALAFQLQVLHTRFALLERTIKENPNSLIITERDITSDYEIFTKMLYDSGMFEEIEFRLYEQLYNNYKERLDKLCMNSRFRIYLTTSAKKSFERMKRRGRSEEKQVSLEYLEKVEKYHKNTFLEKESESENENKSIMLLDGEQDWSELPEEKFKKIKVFVEKFDVLNHI